MITSEYEGLKPNEDWLGSGAATGRAAWETTTRGFGWRNRALWACGKPAEHGEVQDDEGGRRFDRVPITLVFSVTEEYLRQVRERNLRTLRIDWTVGGERAYQGRENTGGHA